MRAFPRTFTVTLALLLFSCGQPPPTPAKFEPLANLPPPATQATPAPGPFNGEVEVTFTTDFPATIYVSLDGSDPRTTRKGRLEGPSPLKVKLTQTTGVSYFAN